MAKSAGRKTKPTQPLHAGVAVRKAAIAARANIRVKAAFSDALPSERGKPRPKAEDTALFKIAAKGWIGLRGGVTASVRVIVDGGRKRAITAVTANPASSQGPGTRGTRLAPKKAPAKMAGESQATRRRSVFVRS
jgi:negative regulator of sigma E activity